MLPAGSGESSFQIVLANEQATRRLAMDVAARLEPLKQDEEHTLLARAAGVEPLFHLGNA